MFKTWIVILVEGDAVRVCPTFAFSRDLFFWGRGWGNRRDVCLLFSDTRETSLLLRSLPRLVQQPKCVLSSCPRRMSAQPELTECILVEQLLFHTVLALYSSVLLLV